MPAFTLYTGGYVDGRIHQLAFDPSVPSLEVVSTANVGSAPTWLTFSADGRFLYATDEWGNPEGTVTALEVQADGSLKQLSTVQTGGLWACHSALLTSTSPPQLLTTTYKGAGLHSVPLLPSGDVSSFPSDAQLLSYLNTGTLGSNARRQEQAHPHGAHPDPRGVVVVVPDLGTDDLRVVGVREDGKLEDVETIHLEAGDGPRHVLFGGDQKLYVLNELSNSVSVFSCASSTSRYPTFTLLQSRISILPPAPVAGQSPFPSWHCAELVLTPDSRTLIASNRAENHDPLNGTKDGPTDVLAIFAVKEDGTLEEGSKTLVSAGGRAPRHMSLSSESVKLKGQGVKEVDEGRFLAVAMHDSDEVVIFERTGGEGRELREVVRKEGLGRPGVVLWA
ncbi:hypothetical protein JCM8097_004053 [Rhodosporidiobolus ruineniae]